MMVHGQGPGWRSRYLCRGPCVRWEGTVGGARGAGRLRAAAREPAVAQWVGAAASGAVLSLHKSCSCSHCGCAEKRADKKWSGAASMTRATKSAWDQHVTTHEMHESLSHFELSNTRLIRARTSSSPNTSLHTT